METILVILFGKNNNNHFKNTKRDCLKSQSLFQAISNKEAIRFK